MENNNSVSPIEVLYDCIKKPELTSEDERFISLYMDAYHETLRGFLNSDDANEEISNRLKQLSEPINYIYKNFPDDESIETPAVRLIKSKIVDYGNGVEKNFTKVRTNPNMPSTISEDNYSVINGFSRALIIIIVTLVLGILLGAVLFKIIA